MTVPGRLAPSAQSGLQREDRLPEPPGFWTGTGAGIEPITEDFDRGPDMKARSREVIINTTATPVVSLAKKVVAPAAAENGLAGSAEGRPHAGPFAGLQQNDQNQPDANHYMNTDD